MAAVGQANVLLPDSLGGSFVSDDYTNSLASSDASKDEEYANALKNKAAFGPTQDGLPSIGSADHHKQACKPCSFYQRNRCMVGNKCTYCHFQHSKGERAEGHRSKKGEEDKDDSSTTRASKSSSTDSVKSENGKSASYKLSL